MNFTATIEHPMTARMIAGRRVEDASIHEDDTARDYGFRGALVPGIVVGAWLMDPICDLWGADWIARGTLELKNVRPVYDGQPIVLRLAPEGAAAKLDVVSAEGEVLAVGSATLPGSAREVDAADYPFLPFDDPLSQARPGTLAEGQTLGGARFVADRAYLDPLLERSMARHPLLTGGGLHPLVFQQCSSWDSIGSFVYETPGIHVWGETIHLANVPVGAELASAGRVTRVWERKGNHYMQTEQLVTADGAPAALVRRNVIYWLAKAAA